MALARLPSCKPASGTSRCLQGRQLAAGRAAGALRRWRGRMSAAAGSDQARSATTTTFEYVTLLSYSETYVEDAGAAAVDALWSLQYMAPGALCGVAGPVAEVPVDGQEEGAGPRYTHAVLLRFPKLASLESFRAHPKTTGVVAAVLAGACNELVQLMVPTELPNNLEALFRRGGDFDAGFELIMLLQLQDGASHMAAEDVLSQLAQLAESSMFGAVQAYYGQCGAAEQLHSEKGGSAAAAETAAEAAAAAGEGGEAEGEGTPGGSGSGSAPPPAPVVDYTMLIRFQAQEQLQAFLKCPPVAALLEADPRLPLLATWAGALEVAPAEGSQTRKQGSGGLL